VSGVPLRDNIAVRMVPAVSIWRATWRRLVGLIPSSRDDWSLVELGFAVAALCASVVSLIAAPAGGGLPGVGLALVMIAIARIDARRLIIPNPLVLAAFALGLCNAGLTAIDGVPDSVALAIVRGAAFASLFLLLQVGYRWLRGREGLGSGDIKLAAAAGTWLDWSTIPVVVEIAAVAALAAYLSSSFAGLREPLRPTSRLPFGLFLAPAIWLGWLLQSIDAQSSMGLSN
jgi:leader peptidase (prepilin peptidase) / N-methyltransferase